MRILIILFLGLSFQQAMPQQVTILTNVTVIDATGRNPQPHQTVVIKNDRIGPSLPARSSLQPAPSRST